MGQIQHPGTVLESWDQGLLFGTKIVEVKSTTMGAMSS